MSHCQKKGPTSYRNTDLYRDTLKCLYNKINASNTGFFIINIDFNLYFGNSPVFMCIPV